MYVLLLDANDMEKYTAKLIAFHLPQFHPIPENDEWWGKGFTEWSNVVKATPLLKDHYQPHLPADLGFYDLRLPEVREAQANLAREYGIHGFCYYHYWFNGKRLLERPFNDVLASGKPDFPFCLCWANENWTRAWDGQEREVLISQQYSEEDDKAHIRSLAPAFLDKRYIRYQGKPIFIVYRTSRLPNPQKTASIWREEALKLGIGEIFLCKIESFSGDRNVDPSTIGFDASIDFQPDFTRLGKPLRNSLFWRLARKFKLFDKVYEDHRIYDYEAIVERMSDIKSPGYKRFPCVAPSWDNSARRKSDATIIKGSSPELYKKWLKSVIESSDPSIPENNFIFINAWNEWAEGCHLEPDVRHGNGYLKATLDALKESAGSIGRPGMTITGVDDE